MFSTNSFYFSFLEILFTRSSGNFINTGNYLQRSTSFWVTKHWRVQERKQLVSISSLCSDVRLQRE